jgi:hypothetical protein
MLKIHFEPSVKAGFFIFFTLPKKNAGRTINKKAVKSVIKGGNNEIYPYF